MLSAARPGKDVRSLDLGALVAALAFALHPLRVESVAWASERRDVVCGALVLASVLAYLRAREPGKPERSLAPALAVHALALLGKGMAMTTPLVLLVLDEYPLRRRAWKEKVPFLVLSAGAAAAGMWAQQRIRWPLEQHGLLGRAAQSFYALAWYPLKTLWPSGLSALHELRPPLDPLEPRFLLAQACVLAAACWLWTRRRRRPAIAASAAAYAVMLAPVSGAFQFGPQLVADRYSYLPMLPAALLAGAAARAGFERSRAKTAAVAALVLAVLLGLTVRQQSYWADGEALWTRVLDFDPASASAQISLGARRAEQGRLHEAEARFLAAAEGTPGCFDDQDRLAEGLRGGATGPEFEALRLRVETNPICRKARANLGAVWAQTGRLPDALKAFSVIALIDPADQATQLNLKRAQLEYEMLRRKKR